MQLLVIIHKNIPFPYSWPHSKVRLLWGQDGAFTDKSLEPFPLPILKVLTQGHFASVYLIYGVHEHDKENIDCYGRKTNSPNETQT